MSQKKISIFDLECLVNFFSYAAIRTDSDQITVFYLSPLDENWKEQLELFKYELDTLDGLIGFNNINYDYPLLHYIITNYDKLYNSTINQVVSLIYAESQRIIAEEYSSIRESEVLIPQLDLFRIWHYNNKARMVSLKSLQISMNWENVQDMPFSHNDKIMTMEDIEKLLSYNINDILSTKLFYEKSLPKIELRKKLSSKYDIDCINWSDSKIGEEVVLKLYSDKIGKPVDQIRKLRTYRSELRFEECIPSYIQFSSKEFNNLLEYLKGIKVSVLKDSFAYSVIYKGFKYDLGTGGIHGANDPGIYDADGDNIIKDSDVQSLYPNLGIKNNLYPEHLGPEFVQVYDEGIVQERIRAKNNKDSLTSDGLKLAANTVYGKSNSEFSFLLDPLYTLKTTLAGQLSLCMLAEQLVDNIPNITVIQINTDGITTKFDKKYDNLYHKICQSWENTTKLILEHVHYSKMIMRDVNSYISVKDDGGIKYKGAFEIDKVVGSEPAYHKDNSFRIVPIALSKYFVDDIPVEETIKNHKDIYDFCGRYKASHGWGSVIHYIEDGNHIQQVLQKTNRYYVSNRGVKYYKYHEDGRLQEIQRNYYVTIFNKFEDKPLDSYDINYSFYIRECNKIIQTISGQNQLSLF